jgi:GR25 family glycosyltransferase involved in LPS biosynthesis
MKIDYTIISVSDRCVENVYKTKNALNKHTYHEISFFNGNKEDSGKELFDRGIRVRWKPFDGRKNPPLSSELGVWISHINILNYIVKNKIKLMMVLEDDAILEKNFEGVVLKSLSEADKFDFVSLYYSDDDHHKKLDVDSEMFFLEKTYNQYSGGPGLIYSLSGAKKILKILKKMGVEYTVDCCLFEWARLGMLSAYRLKKDFFVISHSTSSVSEIDSGNYRYE